MKLLFLVLSCWTSLVIAASTVQVESAFEPNASEAFIKDSLHQMALTKLVETELSKGQFDLAAYQKSFETKFAEWVASLEKGRTAPLSQEEKLAASRRFSRYNSLVRSYAVKSFGGSTATNGVWTMTMEGTIEPTILARHYQRIMRPAGEKPFKKLVIYPRFDLQNFTWKDLGLEQESQFTSVLEDSWEKWFNENAPDEVEEVVLCRADCKAAIEAWRTVNEKDLSTWSDPELRGGLLLTASFQVQRELLSSVLGEVKFTVNGGTIMQDFNTKRVLRHADLPVETRLLRSNSQKEINSALASLLARYPLGKFLEFKSVISQTVALNSVAVVEVEAAPHMGAVLKLGEVLKAHGGRMALTSKLDGFSRTSSRLVFLFKGEAKNFKDLILTLPALESELGHKVQADVSGETIKVRFE